MNLSRVPGLAGILLLDSRVCRLACADRNYKRPTLRRNAFSAISPKPSAQAKGPNGGFYPFSSSLTRRAEVAQHRLVTSAVHQAGAKICMQVLHAGRYSYHPLSVSSSRIKAPINRFTPRALGERGIERQIAGFVRAA
jgi:2,4-dienoyl-CoA reductase-like NADH-dependent reductase (Old Yellow Enzyme family)